MGDKPSEENARIPLFDKSASMEENMDALIGYPPPPRSIDEQLEELQSQIIETQLCLAPIVRARNLVSL